MARNYSGLSPYYTAANQTLEQYVPMPFQEMAAASDSILKRADAIEQQSLATDNLIANMEALAPEHKNYLTNLGKNFAQQSRSLIDQYGGNISDPEFIRQQRRLISKTASDPNFRTILSANEQLKVNQKIAAEMNAKGQLYTNPNFSGLDSSGRLTDRVGNIQLVDTLDKLKDEYKVAWQSMENDNKGTISNAKNINRLNKRVLDSVANGSPEFQRLAQAYVQRGLTPDQAINQIKSDITGLQGQYGIRSERDNSYYNYQLALRQDARSSQEHAMKMRTMSAQLAQMMGQGVGDKTPLNIVTTKGPISNIDLNKDKISMVKELRNHIDDKGNLKDVRSAGSQITVSPTFVPTTNVKGGANPLKSSALRNSSANESLKYMREELGWSPRLGTAKQVADAYEKMVKSDNFAPTIYVPSNPTVFNAIDKQYGNSLEGATYFENGKAKHADDGETISNLERNKSFVGFSTTRNQSGQDQMSLKYRSYTDKDKKNPVIVEIPMSEEMQRLSKTKLKYNSIMQGLVDNNELSKSNMYEIIDGRIFVPRRTSQGLRFAEVTGTIDNNGVLKNRQFVRQSNQDLNYLRDDIVEAKLYSELKDLDNYFLDIYK